MNGAVLARLVVLLFGATGLVFVAGAARDRSIPDRAHAVPPQILEPLRVIRDLDSLGEVVVSRNVFRAHRGPADVRYGSVTEERTAEMPVAIPVLSLTGIVWSHIPAAVVEGLPGAAGARVVEAGETYGELVVKSIARDTVWIVGRDTTWTLTLKPGWQ